MDYHRMLACVPSEAIRAGALRVPSSSPHFPFADSPEFLRLLRGEVESDLTRLALEVARDAYPKLDANDQIAKIDLLAARVRDRCPDGAKTRHILGQINWILFVEEGFRGNQDDYQNPQNSYLNEVLDRKLGIPLSLSILYLAIADRLGLAMSGVNLPGHFLIRSGRGESTHFVDPYSQGVILDRLGCNRLAARATGRIEPIDDAVLAPCSTSTIVVRMLRNLKASYLREHDFEAAVPVLRRLVALRKGDLEERRDFGVVCARAGIAGEALGHLAAYLAARPDAEDSEDIAALARVTRREVAGLN